MGSWDALSQGALHGADALSRGLAEGLGALGRSNMLVALKGLEQRRLDTAAAQRAKEIQDQRTFANSQDAIARLFELGPAPNMETADKVLAAFGQTGSPGVFENIYGLKTDFANAHAQKAAEKAEREYQAALAANEEYHAINRDALDEQQAAALANLTELRKRAPRGSIVPAGGAKARNLASQTALNQARSADIKKKLADAPDPNDPLAFIEKNAGLSDRAMAIAFGKQFGRPMTPDEIQFYQGTTPQTGAMLQRREQAAKAQQAQQGRQEAFKRTAMGVAGRNPYVSPEEAAVQANLLANPFVNEALQMRRNPLIKEQEILDMLQTEGVDPEVFRTVFPREGR